MRKLLPILFFAFSIFCNLRAIDNQKLLDSSFKYIEKGEFELSRELANQVLDELSLEKDTLNDKYIVGLSYIAMSYYYEPIIDSSIYYFEKAIHLNKIKGNSPSKDLARYFTLLGLCYMNKANYAVAEDKLKESIKIINHVNAVTDELNGELLFNLGYFYKTTGKYDLAEKYLLESINIYENLKNIDVDGLASGYNSLAQVFQVKSKFLEAEKYYLKSLDLFEKSSNEDSREHASIYNNIGVFYYQMGDYNSAGKFFEQSFAMIRRLFKEDNIEIATLAYNVGNINLKAKNYIKASEYLINSLNMRMKIFNGDHPDVAKSLLAIGGLFEEQNKLDSAIYYYTEAVDMRRRLFQEGHPDLANAINNLAITYNTKGEYKQSLKLNQEALGMRRKFLSEYDPMIAKNINNLALNYEKLDSIEKSYPLYIELIEKLENIKNNYFPALTIQQREAFYHNIFKLYYFEIYLFTIKNYKKYPDMLVNLFNLEVQNKGMFLNSITGLNQRILNVGDSNLISKFNRWKSIKELIAKNITLNDNQLKAKNINIDSLFEKAQYYEKELTLVSSDFYDEITLNNLRLNDFQSKLSDDEAIVNIKRFYVPKNDSTKTVNKYIFLIVKKNESYPILITKDNYYDLENKYLEIYKDELISIDKDKKSYGNYWAFLEPYLNGIKKIYLSPDGVYNKINLNSLYNNKTKKYNEEVYDIVQLTSLKEMFKTKQNNNNDFVLFGNPDYENIELFAADKVQNDIKLDSIDRSAINLVPLPSSESEVNEITKILDKKKLPYENYLGMDASEENVKKVVSPKVLHLSTHGYFLRDNQIDSTNSKKILNTADPYLRSMLFFTKSNNSDSTNLEDGILTALEAQNLSLNNTELVVLAACETGLGEIRNGEGVYGLQRSFIQAGAHSIIMSLWKVNDKATKDLMVNFYKEWSSGKTKKEAFKKAKKYVKDKYKYPLFWASFIMIGE